MSSVSVRMRYTSFTICTCFSLSRCGRLESRNGSLNSRVSAPFTSLVTMMSKAFSSTASHAPLESRMTGRAKPSLSYGGFGMSCNCISISFGVLEVSVVVNVTR